MFLIGFSRDEPAQAKLVVTFADGSREWRELKVSQRRYKVQRIDGLPPRKVTPSEEDLVRIGRETTLIKKARAQDDARTDFLKGFIWPAKGRITGVYGSQRIMNGEPRRPHYGLDIAAPVGTLVVTHRRAGNYSSADSGCQRAGISGRYPDHRNQGALF